MSLNSVILAVEDSLSDVVSTKILKHFGIEKSADESQTLIKASPTFSGELPNSIDQRRDRFMCLCSQT